MTTDLELATRLRQTIARANRKIRSTTSSQLPPHYITVLALIDRYSDISLGELARLEQVQPPTLTPVIRRLSDLGYLVSRQDDDDRRCTRASLTATGRRELTTVRKQRNEFLEARLATLTETQRSAVASAVELLNDLLELS